MSTSGYVIIRVTRGKRGGKLIARGLSEVEAQEQQRRLDAEARQKRLAYRYLSREDKPLLVPERTERW